MVEKSNDPEHDSTPNPPPQRKIRFRLLSDTQVEALPDPAWLIDRTVPTNGFGVLYGPPGEGKTFLALDLSLSVATARTWCGRQVTPGAAIYVIAEGVAGLKQRVKAWKDTYGFDTVPRIHFVQQAVQLHQRKDVRDFLADLDAQVDEPIVLIVFDTLARCFVGGEENSAKDVGILIDGAEQVRQATGASVMLVHHTTKKGREERGSSALRGSADTLLQLRSSNGLITLSCAKQKDGQPFENVILTLVPALDSCVLRRATEEALPPKAFPCLRALASVEDPNGATAGQWETAASIPASTFHRCRKALVERGFVMQLDKRYMLTEKGRVVSGITATGPDDTSG